MGSAYFLVYIPLLLWSPLSYYCLSSYPHYIICDAVVALHVPPYHVYFFPFINLHIFCLCVLAEAFSRSVVHMKSFLLVIFSTIWCITNIYSGVNLPTLRNFVCMPLSAISILIFRLSSVIFLFNIYHLRNSDSLLKLLQLATPLFYVLVLSLSFPVIWYYFLFHDAWVILQRSSVPITCLFNNFRSHIANVRWLSSLLHCIDSFHLSNALLLGLLLFSILAILILWITPSPSKFMEYSFHLCIIPFSSVTHLLL